MDGADFLIVGGGTAGAVLAARLSEDAATRVTLIEAGHDTPPDALPADIADTFPSSYLNRDYFWPALHAARRHGEDPRPFPQARIMGGGSSVMGLWALRGLAADFDAWAANGADGWAWHDVVKYFRQVEDDAIRKPAGERGPVPIRRVPQRDWPAFVGAMERAVAKHGLARIDDINEEGGDGFFPMPLSQGDQSRASSAICYLTSAVRRRGNLAIIANTPVTALNLSGARANGVVVGGGGSRILTAREVILCAGAIHTPAMLLRAGIGPAGEVLRLGIPPLVDRPGVGKNLQNHLYLHFALTLPTRLRLPPDLRRFAIAGIRLSSGLAQCPSGDLLLFAIGRVSPRSYGAAVGMVGAALYAPFSRGQVTLESPDIAVPPRIDFCMLNDPRDASRMIRAARFAEMILRDPSVASTYRDAFLLPPVMSLHQFNRSGWVGAVLGVAANAVLNAPAPVSRLIMSNLIRPGRWLANRYCQSTVTDEELLAAAAPMAHPVGTCAIGRSDDPMAVVDPACRVYGVDNLRVVDASIMPHIPSANTNLPTLMVAERAAALIRASSGST